MCNLRGLEGNLPYLEISVNESLTSDVYQYTPRRVAMEMLLSLYGFICHWLIQLLAALFLCP